MPINNLPAFTRTSFQSHFQPSDNILTIKLFHHNNLALSLHHDTHFDIYIISIYQINANQIFQPFGMHSDHKSAIAKFNSINL